MILNSRLRSSLISVNCVTNLPLLDMEKIDMQAPLEGLIKGKPMHLRTLEKVMQHVRGIQAKRRNIAENIKQKKGKKSEV